MKVKIGNSTWNGDKTPIMITLSQQEKRNIANMRPDATKYVTYPDRFFKMIGQGDAGKLVDDSAVKFTTSMEDRRKTESCKDCYFNELVIDTGVFYCWRHQTSGETEEDMWCGEWTPRVVEAKDLLDKEGITE